MSARVRSAVTLATLAVVMATAAATFAWLVTPRLTEPAPGGPAPVAVPAPDVAPPSGADVPSAEALPVPDQPGVPEPAGAALFAQYCAGCHSAAGLRAAFARAPDRAATRRAWAALLTDHGRASDAEDRVVLDFLTRDLP